MNVDLSSRRSGVDMHLVTDPPELALARPSQPRQLERNLAWLGRRASEVYCQHRGQCICISGEQVFAANSAREAVALAKRAHPDDQGRFVRYVPREKVPRIYAY